MMRVAYVCADPGVPVFGRKGCSVHVQEVLRALAARGAAVTLVAARQGGDPPADLEAVAVRALPPHSAGDPAVRERAALAANDALRAALARDGPFDLVYERYSLWSHGGMEYARDTGVPGVLEVNAPLIEEQLAHRTLVDRVGAERVAQRAFGAASAIMAVSREVAEHVARYPVAHGRVHVVPNGVSPARFPAELAAALPAPPGTFTVGFLGTLKPWHGLPVLVEAFATLHRSDPATRLLIVGDGPERRALTADLSARGLLGAAELTGAVDPDAVPGLLASMDAGVAPYQHGDFYFSPLKVYEYMAAGLPVAASRIGQLTALIRDGENGLLCTPGDHGDLAAVLARLQAEPELRIRLGRAARTTVLRDHTWDAVVGRALELAQLGAGAQSALAPTR